MKDIVDSKNIFCIFKKVDKNISMTVGAKVITKKSRTQNELLWVKIIVCEIKEYTTWDLIAHVMLQKRKC